jgi:hypothetical protein
MKISKCKNYSPNQGKDYNNSRVAYGWDSVEVPWEHDKIVDLTTKYGISGNEFRDGHKLKDSWVGTSAIMLDLDGGDFTNEWLISEQSEWKFNSYIYSSQNHQKEKVKKSGKTLPACDRLRALIPLDTPIKTIFDLQAVTEYFIDKYQGEGFDKTSFEQNRYFAHGNTIVSNFVDDKAPLDWKNLPGLYDSHKPKVKVSRPESDKYYTFILEDVITDGDGNKVLIQDIKPDTPIYCPVCGHEDYRTNTGHNAVIKINDKTKLPFIFCSSCKSRGLGAGGNGVYNIHNDDGYSFSAKKQNCIVFIDTLTSRYMGGCIESGMEDYIIRPLITIDHVKQFCKYHKLPTPDIFPRARHELVFASDEIFDNMKGFVNKYIATSLLKTPAPDDHLSKLPKYIDNIIDHVLAHDDEIKSQFYNDLAWFIQNRKKLITTYLFQGIEGTGKGFLFSNVLRPILGSMYCSQADQDAFGNRFNSFLQDNVLVLVNEVSGNFSKSENGNLCTIEKMKIAITDEYIQIEGKNKDRINGKNNCSFLFATNRPHGVTLSDSDRRFNVAPWQTQKLHDTKWWPGYNELKKLVSDELQEFVWYLKQYAVDANKIGRVIENDPKKLLQIMSQSNADQFFKAVKDGDYIWLKDHLIENDEYHKKDSWIEIDTLLDGLKDRKSISGKELCMLYNVIARKNLSAIAFGKLAAEYLGKSIIIRNGKDVFRGWEIEWHIMEDL